MYAILCLLSLSVVQLALCQHSPCPHIFHYETDGQQRFGVIRASNPPPLGSEMKLTVSLSIPARLPGDYFGKIVTFEDDSTLLQTIQHGKDVLYKIFFPLLDPVPQIVTINFANRLICVGPPAQGTYVSSISLNHIYRSQYTNQQPNASGPVALSSETLAPIQPPAPRPVIGCGIARNALPLQLNNRKAQKGDWPWSVAIFFKDYRMLNAVTLQFKCGATLISDKHVLTAAHCMIKNYPHPVRPEDVVLKLGAVDISDDAEYGAIERGIKTIKIHEGYDSEGYHKNDLAMLIMKSSVGFTEYIRPICLWEGHDDQTEIYGRDGVIVGWGRDQNDPNVKDRLRAVTVPIVPTQECRQSIVNFPANSFERTLCAGAKDGTGPCSGDSGGGLYLKQQNRWAIRGIVSFALRIDNTCDLSNFVVYTDTAKYSWIRNNR